MKKNTLYSAALVVSVAATALGSRTAFAAGGTVRLATDNTADGYYYGLGGSGSDRFITEYLAGSFDPGSVVCGVRVREQNQGNPPLGTMLGDLRFEDPGNPGFPDLTAGGLVATVDASSVGTCSTSAGAPREFTFGSGAGVLAPASTVYVSAIEPAHGTGALDFCGVLLDTSGPARGSSKFHSGGVFGSLTANHFVEARVFTPACVDLNFRASGSARYPGDRGIPVVFTIRPNAGPTVTDDNITVHLAVDNGTGAAVSRNIDICVDRSVLNPLLGLKKVTGLFKAVGGGPGIMNPVTLPSGRTILRLELTSASVKSDLGEIVDTVGCINLPVVAFVDDPSVDAGACVLDGSTCVDDESQILGLRHHPGTWDDCEADGFQVVQVPNQPGDSFQLLGPVIDLPRVPYTVSGLQVVAGEFGGSGLPGLDAVELRSEDPVFAGSPDLSAQGLLRSFGSADGVGEVPAGPAPTEVTLDVADLFIDPTIVSGLETNFVIRALLLPGESSAVTAIATDDGPSDTLLGNSSFLASGLLPVTPIPGSNAMLRMVLDGEFGTLPNSGGGRVALERNPKAVLREAGKYIAIDRHGRLIR